MIIESNAPATALQRQGRGEAENYLVKYRRIPMQTIKKRVPSINGLLPASIARERRLRELPYPARRLAKIFGIEPETAGIVAEMAALKGGRD